MIKVYIRTTGSLMTQVNNQFISFQGYGKRFVFATQNVELQKALETDPRYGTDWELENISQFGKYEEESKPKGNAITEGVELFAYETSGALGNKKRNNKPKSTKK